MRLTTNDHTDERGELPSPEEVEAARQRTLAERAEITRVLGFEFDDNGRIIVREAA